MILSKSKIFFYSCLFFIIGVGIGSFLPFKYIQSDIFWFSCVLMFFIAFVFANKKNSIFALFLVMIFLGVWRYSLSIPISTSDKVWYYNGQTVVVQGVVTDEPDVRKSSQKIVISNLKDLEGSVLVTTSQYPEYQYGDVVELKCGLKKPEEFNGFAYDKYLARHGVYSVCYYPQKIKKIDHQAKKLLTRVKQSIFSFKDRLRTVLEVGLQEPETGLAKAIILGDKRVISDSLRETFSQVGLSHIIAISGMHIGILIVVFIWFYLSVGFWRGQLFFFVSLTLFAYIILVGAPASAVRAGIMGVMILLAMHLGRTSRLDISLIFAGSLMLLFNPKLLRDDIGFQLSFLAVLSIIYLYPFADRLFEKIKKIFPILNKRTIKIGFDILAISLVVQVATLPIVLINFGQVAVMSPISNLLVIWVLPFLMTSLIAGLFLSIIVPALSTVFLFPSFVMLKYIIFVANIF